MIITVPVHIRKIHHTKTVYKIIEKPVYPDIGQVSGLVGRPQSPVAGGAVKPDADFRIPTADNENKTNLYDVHSGRSNAGQRFEKALGHLYESQSKNEPKGKYGLDFIPTGYLGHGNELKGSYSAKGYQQHSSFSGEEGRERGLWRNPGERSSGEDYGRSTYNYRSGRNGVQRIHPVVEHTAESSHGRSTLQYTGHGQAHRGNGVADAIIWHVGGTSHMTGAKHGYVGNAGQAGSQKSDGDAKSERMVNAKHGHVGGAWRANGQKQGGGDTFEHVTDPKHGHVGNVWRANGQNQGGGHTFEHVTNAKHGHYGDMWRGQRVRRPWPRPYYGKHGPSVRGRHNDGGNNAGLGSAYRGSGAGYRVQENAALDFASLMSTISPQLKTFLSNRNYTLATGRGDTVRGMSSVSSIAVPPTVKNVYYTLDPVVPYDDKAKSTASR